MAKPDQILYAQRQNKTLLQVLQEGRVESEVKLKDPSSTAAQKRAAKNQVSKINRVITRLSTVRIDYKGITSILNVKMNQLVTNKGIKVLGDVLTDSKITNLTKGGIGEIGERLKNAWNSVGYQQGFLDTKKYMNPNTVMGAYARNNPKRALIISKFADIVEGITEQRQVKAWAPDSLKKFTNIMKNLQGDFKMSMGLQLYGGWRPGDLMTARIENIDWERGTIRDVTIKSGVAAGGTEAKILVLGRAELAILKEGIGQRTEGPVFLTKQAAIDKVLNNKIAKAFDLPIETVKGGETAKTRLTQKYMRKGFVDLMEAAGYSTEEMEIKQGRKSAKVIKNYLSVESNINKIRYLSDDVAKAIAGYSGDRSVGRALARSGISKNSIKFGGAHLLPVSLKDLPNKSFAEYAKANFAKTWKIISSVLTQSFYGREKGLADIKTYDEVSPPGKGLVGDIDEGVFYDQMQHQSEIQKAADAQWDERKRISASFGIDENKMSLSHNRKLIDDEIIRLREEMLRVQEVKVKDIKKPPPDKPLQTDKANKLRQIAKELGADLSTAEGRKAIRQFLKKGGIGTLGIAGGLILPGIRAFDDPSEYKGGLFGKGAAIAGEVALFPFPLDITQFGGGTIAEQEEYGEWKEGEVEKSSLRQEETARQVLEEKQKRFSRIEQRKIQRAFEFEAQEKVREQEFEEQEQLNKEEQFRRTLGDPRNIGT
jgi:integrase